MTGQAGRASRGSSGNNGPKGAVLPGRREVWRDFWLWVVGLPLCLLAGAGVLWAIWQMTGGRMTSAAQVEYYGIVAAILLFVLAYPVLLVICIADLRRGLRAADLAEAEKAGTGRPVPRGVQR